MLAAPLVVPPLTPWSRSVRVKHQLPGATVVLYADDVAVGSGVVGSQDGWVPLDVAVTLQPNQRVIASQELNGQTSPRTAPTTAVTVLNEPTAQTLASAFSRAPISECSNCLWLEGVVPGATVDEWRCAADVRHQSVSRE